MAVSAENLSLLLYFYEKGVKFNPNNHLNGNIMNDEFEGYDPMAPEVVAGRVQALDIIVLHLMRVISAGLTGEEAYQKVATGLRADAAKGKAFPGDFGKGYRGQLEGLALTLEQPPQS